MKRMSEVLCRPLPISADELLHVFINETSIEDDAAVAHAINHVDALADALASLLETCLSNGRLTTDDAACALEALKSYVGDDK